MDKIISFIKSTKVFVVVSAIVLFVCVGLYQYRVLEITGAIGFPTDEPWRQAAFARSLVTQSPFPHKELTASSPTWVVLLAIGTPLGENLPLWANLLSVICLALTVLYVYKLAFLIINGNKLLASLCALLTALEWRLIFSALSGLETTLFIFLALFGIYKYLKEREHPIFAIIIAGVLTLVRPEGVLLFLAIIVAIIVHHNRSRKRAKQGLFRQLGMLIGVYFAIVVLLFAFNWILSGSLWSRAFYGGILHPNVQLSGYFLDVFRFFSQEHLVFLFPFFILFLFSVLLRIDKSVNLVPIAWFFLLLIAYAAFPTKRYAQGQHLIPLIPLLIIYAIYSLFHLFESSGIKKGSLLVGIYCALLLVLRIRGFYTKSTYLLSLQPLFFVYFIYLLSNLVEGAKLKEKLKEVGLSASALIAFAAIPLFAFYMVGNAETYARDVGNINQQVAMGRWLSENTPDGTTIAANYVGVIGFFSKRRVVNLVNMVISKDKERILGPLLEKKADYLVVSQAWYPGAPRDVRLKELHRVTSDSSQLVAYKITERPASDEKISIEHAHFRKLSKFDNGTIHLFLKNKSDKTVTITKVFLDWIAFPPSEGLGIPFMAKAGQAADETDDSRSVWYRVLPNPVPPGRVSDVMVKCASSPEAPRNIGIETNDGQMYYRVIQPVNNPLRITYVGFSDELSEVYIYLENSGKETLRVNGLFIDSRDVTRYSSEPWDFLSQGQKRCIIVKLEEPLRQGEYIAVKAVAEDNIAAEAVVRVFSFFPINFIESGDIGSNLFIDLFTDQERFDIPYPGDETEGSRIASVWKDERDKTKKAYYLLGCPSHRHGTLSNAARKIFKRADICRNADPYHPAYIHICRYRKEKSFFVFGENADIIFTNPHQNFAYSDKLLEKNEHPTQWITALAKKGCEPRPLYTVTVVGKDSPYFTSRFPSPEEERLLVYYEISRGSKGILYRAWGWPNGKSPFKELGMEVKKISGELQVLKRFLKVGEPVSLAEASEERVEASTILSGDKAIVLILINHDVIYLLERDNKPFSYKAKYDFTVTVHVPKWMSIKDVYEVGGKYQHMKYTKKGNDLSLAIDKLGTTRQFVLTTDPNDYTYDQDGDGISDIREVSVLSTHPAVPNRD